MSYVLGLYLHIPFCPSICHYCNFNRGLFDGALKTRYVDALAREIAGAAEPDTPADTIFFGGGTPSLLEPADVGRLIAQCRQSFGIADAAQAHVARALGHANTTMLHRTYGHLRPEHLVEVVEALPDLHIGPERAQEGTLAQPVPKKSAQVASKYDENSKNKNPGEACNLPGLLSFPLCPDPELNQGHGDFQSVNFKKWQQPATRDNNDFR